METINAEDLGRGGVGVAEEIGYKRGYIQGVQAVLSRVNG